MMNVKLIVLQGKPVGMTIPLRVPTFRIGRGENCHLRPNSEEISRNHAQFSISPGGVVLRDMGSRNGTLVNNHLLSGPCLLKDGDLIQVGALTFAISIDAAPLPVSRPAPDRTQARPARPDDVSNDEIESWLVADKASPTPDRPSGVYGGETQSMDACSHGKGAAPVGLPAEAEAEIGVEEVANSGVEAPEASLDESNSSFEQKPQPAAKPVQRDSSDVASDILTRLLERKRVARHSAH